MSNLLQTLLASLAALFLIAAPVAARQAPARTATWVECTPTTVAFDGGVPQPATNPIARALERAAPGCRIELSPGDYPAFRINFGRGDDNAETPGGTRHQPIVVAGGVGVRVLAPQGGDTLAVTQRSPVAWITFQGIQFQPSYRTAVIFYRVGEGEVHRGFRFEDCDILGGWDHVRAEGRTSKWGVNGQGLADFAWVGVTRPSVIRDIRHEHAFYLQNPAGDILIENVEARRLGRTFVQFTSRSKEGAPGRGTITVRNCRISDACIAAGDAYKGGSAFTLTGNSPEATFVFEGNSYRAGFDPRLKQLTREGVPYGTGAFVAWSEGETARNGTVILRDNDFRMAADCGERPLVSLGACEEVRLEGDNRFVAGAWGVALALDPPRRHGVPEPLPNRGVRVVESPTLGGRLEVAGRTPSDADRKALGL